MFLNICGFNEPADKQMHKYNEKISYADGKEIKFPDFSIKFIGTREVKYPKDTDSQLKMTIYDFEVAKGETKKKISWSSGTGDIGPTFFEIGGGNYVLELSKSDILGAINEGNFVVWKKVDYEEALRNKTK